MTAQRRIEYNSKELSRRIKECRRAIGITRAQCAELVGMDNNAYGNIEDGRRGTSLSTLITIARVLETSLDYLVSGRSAADREGTADKRSTLADPAFEGLTTYELPHEGDAGYGGAHEAERLRAEIARAALMCDIQELRTMKGLIDIYMKKLVLKRPSAAQDGGEEEEGQA